MNEPLHALSLEAGQWWACAEPERPDQDSLCVYDERCRACQLKAAAELAMSGDTVLINVEDGRADATLADLAAGRLA